MELLDRIRQKGVKINRDKMKLHLSKIKHMGHMLTAEGLKADPDKIRGIQDLAEPENKTEMKRFLGTVNYLSKFIPGLSQMAEKLREATKEGDFKFGEPERKAWFDIKEAIKEDVLLRYYNPNKPAVIECDASGKGLGAVFLQENKSVYFASRALTETEEKYHP